MTGECPLNPFSKLPNELLIKIAESVGPPDISCCDPGWLVLPAVCRRFRAVAKSIRVWDCGSINEAGSSYGQPTWHDIADESIPRQPSSVPTMAFRARGRGCYVRWNFTPTYKGGSVDYSPCSLEVTPQSTHAHDGRRHIDRYLGHPLIFGNSSRFNATWINTLVLDCKTYIRNATLDNVSFERVPCLVAPALQELTLGHYVVDWRCETLKILRIYMDRNASLSYRYPPPHLLSRLSESCHTLERVDLVHCLSAVLEADEDPGPRCAFSRLSDFQLTAISFSAGYLARRMEFPSDHPPTFNVYGPALGFLRSLICRDAGEIDALTIREATRGSGFECTITGSSISSPAFDAQLYASARVPRLDRYGFGQVIKKLDQFAGLKPNFTANLQWDISRGATSREQDLHAFRSVRHLFVNGKKGRLFRQGTADRDIWKTLLRQLPNVRNLYINAPHYDALAPLLVESKNLVLPELESLWLGCGPGRPEEDVNAAWLLDMLDAREEAGHDLEIILDGVRLVGDAETVQEFDDLCS